MSWFDRLTGRATEPSAEDAARLAEWERALQANRVPSFVEARLKGAAAGKIPWIATMTPSELRLARSHGIRPLAMVSGTCWYHYGYSWTRGHSEGWHAALGRMWNEAVILGANAIVDVKMRTIRLKIGESMDYTVLGTAVRIDGLPPSSDPVIATVPALEFVRLLEAGIVPVGVGIGAHYDWLPSTGVNLDGALSFRNQPLTQLGNFWETVRRQALRELYQDTQRLGTGVLAHTHFGQLLKFEEEKRVRYLGRHIVIGTIVQSQRGSVVPHEIRTVVDMRDGASPLLSENAHGHNTYPVEQEGGLI
jgi:hypothetical protein